MEENTRLGLGLGRSGPRKKTGCLTCRRRKVRCDERKPVCNHCVRLQLRCQYSSQHSSSSTDRNDGPRPAPVSLRPAPNDTGSNANGTPRSENGNTSISLRPVRSSPDRPGRSHRGSGALDIDQLLDSSSAELPETHQELNHRPSPGAEPAPLLIFPSDGGSSISSSGTTNGPTLSPVTANLERRGEILSPDSNIAYEERLLQYFRNAEPPDAIFAPLVMEWKFAKPAVLSLAPGFSPLLNAIYCYSAVHKSKREGRSCKGAFPYYREATAGLQSQLVDDIGNSTLRKVFAAVFFLMMAELLSDSELGGPNTSLLRSSHLLLSRYRDKTKSWHGTGRLFVSWIILLDVRSIIAGRDGDVLVEPLESPEVGYLRHIAPQSNVSREDEELPEDEAEGEWLIDSSSAFILHDSVVGPVLHFHVESQKVNRRIVHIDLHHRTRGTLGDEYEVLDIARKVSRDLEALWRARPRLIDTYDRPDELHEMIAPGVANHVCCQFRVYVANFLAQFIYLHRVAFSIYPRTERVNGSVEKIVGLASLELDASGHLPAGFLWPLFMAGLEGSVSQQEWVEEEISRMADSGNEEEAIQKHPNIEKVAPLFKELTRRQSMLKVAADSRCVRRELFTDYFVMI